MTTLTERLNTVRQRIARAEQAAGRPAGSVTLLAVSKTQPAAALAEAFALGQRAFGESYLQEAEAKIAALADKPIQWHFIGPIQSNKTRLISRLFDWVHGIDRLKVAQRLNDQRPAELAPLNVCVQVNISGEASKAGISTDELSELAAAIRPLSRLRLRGLMTLPASSPDPDEQRLAFRQLRRCLEQLNRTQGLQLDTLSMGMTQDLEAAIAEGATIVRVGTGIFGPRRDNKAR
jgi:pyridoxal phosphate enzyme (YggS family)